MDVAPLLINAAPLSLHQPNDRVLRELMLHDEVVIPFGANNGFPFNVADSNHFHTSIVGYWHSLLDVQTISV